MRSHVLSSLLLCALLPAAVGGGASRAQSLSSREQVIVRATQEDCRTLPGALTTIAGQAAVTFVTEGRPYKATLGDNDVPVFPPAGLPLREAVDKIAAAFDYAVERQNNTFLLRKRYTDPNDLPEVTLEECALAASDLARVLKPFDSGMKMLGIGRNPAIEKLMKSLTPEQWTLMSKGETQKGAHHVIQPIDAGLPISQLSPEQQQTVRRYALFSYTGENTDIAAQTAQDIKQIAAEGAIFVWRNVNTSRLLGYELPAADTSKEQPLFRPLSDAAVAMPGGGLRIFESPKTPPVATVQRLKTSRFTLKDALAGLAARHPGGVSLSVDDALAAKQILVVGGEKQSPPVLLRALADVYGLRVMTQENGALRLTRRSSRPISEVNQLREAVIWALPDPVIRALQVTTAAPDTGRVSEGTKPKAPRKSFGAMAHLARTISGAAARDLRADLVPRLSASPTGQAPLLALDPEKRTAFATMLIMDCAQSLEPVLVHPVPNVVSRINQLYITGSVYESERDGKPWYSFFLALPSGQKLIGGPGLFNRKYW